MKRLDGKSVLITGGSIGIGKAMAALFCHEGAHVVIGDIDTARGEAAAQEIRAQGGAIQFVAMDVTDEASVKAAVDFSVQSAGKLEVLVNNAGGSTLNDRSVVEMDLEEFWRAIKVDLYGTVLTCRHAIPRMIDAGGGAIVNMGSIAALRGLKGRDAYTAAKGGVTALSRSIAVEFADQKIRCNVIAPGAVRTERMEHFIQNDPRVAQAVSKHLLGLPDPDEIAQMALFLASDESRHVTGAIFQIDGGRSAVA